MELTATKYKQTEVGLIPEDWELINVGEAINMGFIEKPIDGNHGNIHPKKSDFVNNGIPFIMANNVLNGYVDTTNCSFITKRQADSLQKGFSYSGDVLLTHKGTVGNVAIVDKLQCEYIMLTPQVTYYRVNTSKLNNKYLKGYFESIPFQKTLKMLSGGGTRAYIGIVKQKELPLIIPPTLTEQKAIAKVLSDTDALIQALEKKIDKKKLIKKGVMQKLLTPKEGWDYIRLGDITTMNSGGTPTSTVSEYYGGNIVWVSISDISDSGKYISNSLKKISEEGLSNSSARLFKSGTVLLAMYASIGKCCIATNDVTTSQAILGITTSKELLNEYLYYYLIYKVNDLISQGQQGTQSNLNKGIVQDYQIHLPKPDEQKQIAQTLSDIDKEIENLAQKKSKYQLAKQGMMQQLLTGKIRLV